MAAKVADASVIGAVAFEEPRVYGGLKESRMHKARLANAMLAMTELKLVVFHR